MARQPDPVARLKEITLSQSAQLNLTSMEYKGHTSKNLENSGKLGSLSG